MNATPFSTIEKPGLSLYQEHTRANHIKIKTSTLYARIVLVELRNEKDEYFVGFYVRSIELY